MKAKNTKPKIDTIKNLRESRNILDDVIRLLWNESMDHHDAVKGSFRLYGMRVSAKELESAHDFISEVIENLE